MSKGRKLGKYELRELLGKGGMAEVWKAFQPGVEREVAIKLMHKHLADQSDFVERFRREARAVGQLQHNNIMRVIDFDVDGDEYYMVMDFIQGGTLGEYMKDNSPLPPQEALKITAQLADALAYAHERGMVHRDIKPANVIFMDDTYSCPVLTDFGIARLLGDQTMTMTGSMVGTPAYMSPEAIRGEKVDGRADIYSLGVMLYEMVVGKTPYTADTPYGMILKQMHDPLPPPREVNPDVPEVVEQVVLKALAKDPDERYQNAVDFHNAVFEALASVTGSSAKLSLASRGVRSRAAKQKEKSAFQQNKFLPIAAAVGGVLAIALLVVGLLWTSGDGGGGLGAGVDATPTSVRENVVAVVEATATEVPPTETEVPPTETSAPTETSVPTETPTEPPTPTEAPTEPPTPTEAPPTATATPTPVVNALGALHFMDTDDRDQESAPAQTEQSPSEGYQYPSASNTQENVRASDFLLELAHVARPPPGSHYELWLADEEDQTPLNLGQLSVENGRVAFAGSTEENLIGSYSRLLISVEADEDPDSAISDQIAFTGALPPEYTAHVRQLLVAAETVKEKAFLSGASEQMRIAIQHSGFLEEELEKDDLSVARKHAEHIINVLDGEEGTHFGDMDQSGLAENPGDGFGVRPYLEGAKEQAQAALDTIPATGEFAQLESHAQQLLATTDKNLTLVEDAIKQAEKIFAADDVPESVPMSEELKLLLQQLLSGVDEDGNNIIDPLQNEGGIDAAYELALLKAQIPVVAEGEEATVALPAPEAGQLGVVQFADNETVRAGDYLLLANLPNPPANSHYELWFISDEGDIVASLAGLDMDRGRLSVTERTEQNLFANVKQALISLEPDDDAEPDVPAAVVFGGEQSDAIFTALGLVLLEDNIEENSEGLGLLPNAEEQARLAIQHGGFLQDALAQNELDTAKVHAEHVINILDGESGEHFGDFNGDEQAQNPGDGVGVRVYLDQTNAQIQTLLEEEAITDQKRFYGEQALLYSSNAQATVEEAIKKAQKVFAMDSVQESQPVADELTQLLDQLLNGADQDGNGVVDPAQNEGGILSAYDFALRMAQIELFTK
ncbi:MAG: protein kinase domain-containing protein [Ardenticatenaceae bacterium]